MCVFQAQEEGNASSSYVPVTPPSLQAFSTYSYGSYQDANIPFPRTSGARFCGTGECPAQMAVGGGDLVLYETRWSWPSLCRLSGVLHEAGDHASLSVAYGAHTQVTRPLLGVRGRARAKWELEIDLSWRGPPPPRSLSALSAYHSGVLTPMKIRSESQSSLRLYSGSPTRSEKEQVSISSFYYKERVSTAGVGGRTIGLAAGGGFEPFCI